MKKIIKKPTIRETRQIIPDEIKKIRKHFHQNQNKFVCPILKMKFHTEDMVVDHAHKSNSKNLNKEEEAGLIRGVIHRQANTMEGKITNSYIRCGLHKMEGITLPNFLRNLADFIEDPPMIPYKYLHPTEKPKSKELKKTSVKKLIKTFRLKYPHRKLPEVLKYKKIKTGRKKGKERKKKLTAGLEKLYNEFNLEPDFKKG